MAEEALLSQAMNHVGDKLLHLAPVLKVLVRIRAQDPPLVLPSPANESVVESYPWLELDDQQNCYRDWDDIGSWQLRKQSPVPSIITEEFQTV